MDIISYKPQISSLVWGTKEGSFVQRTILFSKRLGRNLTGMLSITWEAGVEWRCVSEVSLGMLKAIHGMSKHRSQKFRPRSTFLSRLRFKVKGHATLESGGFPSLDCDRRTILNINKEGVICFLSHHCLPFMLSEMILRGGGGHL